MVLLDRSQHRRKIEVRQLVELVGHQRHEKPAHHRENDPDHQQRNERSAPARHTPSPDPTSGYPGYQRASHNGQHRRNQNVDHDGAEVPHQKEDDAVDPVSTMIISSAILSTDFKALSNTISSSFTIIHTLIVIIYFTTIIYVNNP